MYEYIRMWGLWSTDGGAFIFLVNNNLGKHLNVDYKGHV